jgi:hypothetical protein
MLLRFAIIMFAPHLSVFFFCVYVFFEPMMYSLLEAFL